MLKGVINQGLFKHSFCSMREQESRLVKMAVLALETGKTDIAIIIVIYQQTVEVKVNIHSRCVVIMTND